jgi:predicted negative regulator of RcsB-dependent stress response
MRIAGSLLLIFLFLHIAAFVGAQPGTTIDLKKPEKYENRTLASEKTPNEKIGRGKKFYQNTITHYNYYFNANNRINAIIDRAKQSSKDDYTQLLPYYSYSLDLTATDPDIDSVIYKCNAGILLHDLRNDWIDDLYFLMGKAYYLRKDFDSAERVFLYINYAFAPKDDGYDIPIGSNASGTVFTIATKEPTGLKEKLSKPPRRNEDLIWVAKNYLDKGRPYEASSILEILRSDPNFPERLQPELHETLGYLFYTEKNYDSAAFHLSKATNLDDDRQAKARREYLTAQLYMMSDSNKDAKKYFALAAQHTTDPVMEIYANLNEINASGDSSSGIIDKKIASLLHLARRDKFVGYRDLIYYTAAQIEMERKNYPDAYTYLKKSIKYNTIETPLQRSISFMALGDVLYEKPDYIEAKNAYDSVDAGSLKDSISQQRLTTRLAALEVIAANLETVHDEDSVQLVARMPEAQRIAFIKKTVRRLRRAQGLKDEDSSVFINPAVQSSGGINGNNAPADLFAANTKGDWYFNNPTIKASGINSFRVAWGNRPNIDNWQRIDAINKQIAQQGPGGNDPDQAVDTSGDMMGRPPFEQQQQQFSAGTGEISYDALLANVPLTDAQMQASNLKIIEALFKNAQQFQNELEDYDAAIASYDSLNKRFPDNIHLEESLAGLYYCYNKIEKKFSADSALTVLKTKFKDGKYAKLLTNPPTKEQQEDDATKAYENVYNLFLEGKFDEAKAAKAQADTLYGDSHWSAQLLFIEAIYYVSKREDSAAIDRLTQLTDQFSDSPLAQRAQNMIDVLRRRPQIERYLTNLQVTRLSEDEPAPVVNLNPVENLAEKKPETKNDSVVSKPVEKTVKPNVDTVKTIAGAEKTYVFNASDQQFAAILMNKVDPVYVTETRNAFNRYNQANFYNQKINITSNKISDTLNVVLLGPFSDAASALIYINKVKPQTAGVIIPWLKPDKYSFSIISQRNFDILNNTKDLQGYQSLLQKVLPGKF